MEPFPGGTAGETTRGAACAGQEGKQAHGCAAAADPWARQVVRSF